MLNPTGALDASCHVKEALSLSGATLSSDFWIGNKEELVKYFILKCECVSHSQLCDGFRIAIFLNWQKIFRSPSVTECQF